MMILDKLRQDRLNGKVTQKAIFPANKNGIARTNRVTGRTSRTGQMEISITPLLAAALAACTGDNIGRPLQPGAGGGPGGGGGGPAPGGGGPTDQAPTALTVTPQSGSVDEGPSTAQKLADITFTDDELGTNTITLPTGSIFEIRMTSIRNSFELWLRPDVGLDFEMQNRYTVTLTPTVSGAGDPPPPQIFTLTVNNIPEPTPQPAYFGQPFNVQLPPAEEGQTYQVESLVDESGRPVAMDDTGWLQIDTTTGTLSGTPRANYEVPATRFSFVASTRPDAQGNPRLHLTPVFEGEAGYEPSTGKQIFVDTGRTKTITLSNGERLTYSILEPIGPGDAGYVAPMETVSDDNRFFLVTIRRSDGEAFTYYIPVSEPPAVPVFEGGRDDNGMELPIMLNLLENTRPMEATVEGQFSPAGDSSTSYTIEGASPLPNSAPDSLTTYTISGGVADESQSGFTHRVDGAHGRLFFNMETGEYRFIGTAGETFTVTMTDDDDTSREVEIEIEVPTIIGDPAYLGDLTDYVANADDIRALSFAFADNVPQAIRDLFAIEGSRLRYVGEAQDYEAVGGTRTWTFDIIVTDMDSPEDARRQDTATITVNLEDIPGTNEPRTILSSIAHRIIDTPAADDFADIEGSFPTIADAGASLTYTVSQIGGTATSSLVSQVLQRWEHTEWHPVGSGETPAESVITYLYRQEDGTETTYRLVLGAERTGRTEVSVEIGTKPAVADTSQAGYTHRVDGKYGQLFFNSGTGTYKYVPNDDAINGLAAGQTDTDEFEIVANDGTGNSMPKTLTINIRGGADRLNFDDTPELIEPPTQPPLSDYLAIINAINAKGVLGISGGVTYKTALDNAFRTLFTRPPPPASETSVTIEDDAGGTRTAPVRPGTIVHTEQQRGHVGSFYTETGGVFGPSSQNGIYTIDENADGSSTAIEIGRPVSATDEDGNSITYSLESPPAGFEIDSSTGQIRYTGSGLNYEATPTISLTVVATSTNGRIEKTVTILVRNLHETLVLHEIAPHTITDTSEVDDFEDIEGAFVADHDGSFTIEYKVGGQVADTSQSGYTHRVDGRYGDLFFNERTGTYKYVPNDNVINGLGVGHEDSDNFEVTVEDRVAGLDLTSRQDRTDIFVSNSQLLTINVRGAEDALSFGALSAVAQINYELDDGSTPLEGRAFNLNTGPVRGSRIEVNLESVTVFLPITEVRPDATIREGIDYSGAATGLFFAGARAAPGQTITYSLEGAPAGWRISNVGQIIYAGPALEYDRYVRADGTAISGTPIIEFTIVAQVGSTRIERPVRIEVLNVADELPSLEGPNLPIAEDTRAYDDFPDVTGRRFADLDRDYSFRAPDSVVEFEVTQMREGTTINPVATRMSVEREVVVEGVVVYTVEEIFGEIVGTRTSPDGSTATVFSTHRIDGAYGSLFYHNTLGYYKYVRDDAAINAVPAGMEPDDVFTVTMRSVGPDGEIGTGDDPTATVSYTFTIRGADDDFSFGTVPNDLTVAENRDGRTNPIDVGSPVTASDVDAGENAVTNAFYSNSFYNLRITAQTAGPAGNNIQVRLVYDATARPDTDTETSGVSGTNPVIVRGAGTSADPYIITVYVNKGGATQQNIIDAIAGHTAMGTGDTGIANDLISAATVRVVTIPLPIDASSSAITFQLGQAVDSVTSYALQDSEGNAPTNFAIDNMGQITYTGPAVNYEILTEEQRSVTLTVVATLAGGSTVQQGVTIRFTDVANEAPVLLLEGQAGPVPVGAPITVTDPRGRVESYELRDADGNEPGNFEIETDIQTRPIYYTAGQIYYTGAALDYDALTAEQRTITLTVIANIEGGFAVEQNVMVDITTLPTLTAPGQIFVRDTANTVDTSFTDLTGTFAGSDVEGDPLRFAVERQVADASESDFTHRVDGLYGTLYFNENTGAYKYVVRDAAFVEGMQGSTSDDDDFLVSVSDGFYKSGNGRLRVSLEGENDNFEFTTSASTTYRIDENADGSTTPVNVGFIRAITRAGGSTSADGITYRLEGAPDGFGIVRNNLGTGVIEYRGTGLDFETSGPISFIVIAEKAGETPIKRPIVVRLNNVDEAADLQIAERDITDTVLLDEFEPLTGQFGVADPDSAVGYTLTGEALLDATDTADAAQLAAGFTHKAVGSFGTLYFNAASGTYRYEPDDDAINAVGPAGATETFEVRTFTATNSFSPAGVLSITRTVNSAPPRDFNINIIGADDAVLVWQIPDDLEIPENQGGSVTTVGSPVTLVDPEGTLTVTYSLEDVPFKLGAKVASLLGSRVGLAFTIDETTGQISYTGNPVYDREITPSVTFTVVATITETDTYQIPDVYSSPAQIQTESRTTRIELRTPVTITITNVVETMRIYHSVIYHSHVALGGGSAVLDPGYLFTFGGDSLGGPAQFEYRISDNSDTGNFELLGDHDDDPTTPDTWQAVSGTSAAPLTVVFTQADVNAGRVRYVPTDPTANTDVSFSFVVEDSLGAQVQGTLNVQENTGPRVINSETRTGVTLSPDGGLFASLTLTLGAAPAALEDTSADDDFADITGQFTASGGTNIRFSIVGQGNTDAVSFRQDLTLSVSSTHSVKGKYGTLFIDQDTGHYRYIPNDDAINALSTGTHTDNFQIKAYNGAGAFSALQTFTVTIMGADDTLTEFTIPKPFTLPEGASSVTLGTVTATDRDKAPYSLVDAPAGFVIDQGGYIFYTGTKAAYDALSQEERTSFTVAVARERETVTVPLLTLAGDASASSPIFVAQAFPGSVASAKYSLLGDSNFKIGPYGHVFYEGTAAEYSALTTAQRTIFTFDRSDAEPEIVTLPELTVPAAEDSRYSLVGAPAGFTIDVFGSIFYGGTKTAYDALTTQQKTSFTVSVDGTQRTVEALSLTLPDGFDGSTPRFVVATEPIFIIRLPVLIETYIPDDVTYSLVNPPAGFSIDSVTGQIRYTGAAFDYEALTEAGRVITLTVEANGVQATARVIITDIDEGPTLPVVEASTISYDQTQTGIVLTSEHLLSTDADAVDGAEQLTYGILDLSGRLQILGDHDDDANTPDTWQTRIAYVFTQADVNAGRVRYVPSDTVNSDFTFYVQDSGRNAVLDQTLTVTKNYRVVEDSIRFDTDGDQIANLVSMRHGSSGTLTFISAANTRIEGTYGAIIANPGGTWEYRLNNDHARLATLNGGQTLTETFTYYAGLSATPQTLTITIEGRTDMTITTADPFDQSSATADLVIHNENPSTGNQTIRTGAGNDIILVSTITESAGNGETIYAGAGNDEVYGGDGSDGIYGEAGDDYIEGGEGADIIEGGADSDELWGGMGNDILRGDAGDDRLYGQAGNDELYGGDGDDRLYGSTGDDTLQGGAGRDIITGGADSDAMRGGAGDDTLMGGAGDDILRGGTGADVLIGGAGADKFVLDLTDGLTAGDVDVVRDFVVGSDRVQVDIDGGPREITGINNLFTALAGVDIRVEYDADKNNNTGYYTDPLGLSVAAGSNDPTVTDLILYHRQGTAADTSDDIIIMVVEDVNVFLTSSGTPVFEFI